MLRRALLRLPYRCPPVTVPNPIQYVFYPNYMVEHHGRCQFSTEFHSKVQRSDHKEKYLDHTRSFFDDKGNCMDKKKLKSWIGTGGEEENNAMQWLISFYNLTVSPEAAYNVIKAFNEIHLSPGKSSYVTVLQGFSKLNSLEQALCVYQDGKDRGYEFDQISQNMLVNLCLRSNQSTPAFHIASRMIKENQLPDMITIHDLLKKIITTDNIYLAKHLIVALSDQISLKQVKLNEILSDTAWNEPLRIFKLCNILEDSSFIPEEILLTKMIGGFIRKNDLQRAIQLSSQIEGENGLNETQLNSLLIGCVIQGNLEAAQVYSDTLLSKSDLSLSVLTVALTAMVSGYIDQKKFNDAVHLMQRVKEERGEVDIILMESLFRECMKASEIQLAIHIVTSLVDIHTSHSQIFDEMCDTLIYNLIQSRHLHEAREFISLMHKGGYNNQHLINRLFNSFINEENGEEVATPVSMKYFKDLGLQVKETHYNLMISKYASSKETLSASLSLFKEMKNYFSPTMATYSLLLLSLSCNEEYSRLEDLCDHILEEKRDIPSPYSLTSLCSSAAETLPSTALIHLMNIFKTKFNFTPDADCVLGILSNAVEENDTKSVLCLLSIAQNTQESNLGMIYKNVFRHLLENQKYELVRSVLSNYLKETSPAIRDPSLPASILIDFIHRGKEAEVKEIMEELKGEISIHNSVFPPFLSYSLTCSYDKAKKAVQYLMDFQLRVDSTVFQQFVNHHSTAKHSDIYDLLDAFSFLKKKGLEDVPSLYLNLIQVCINQNESLAALRCLDGLLTNFPFQSSFSRSIIPLIKFLLKTHDIPGIEAVVKLIHDKIPKEAAKEKLALVLQYCTRTKNVRLSDKISGMGDAPPLLQ